MYLWPETFALTMLYARQFSEATCGMTLKTDVELPLKRGSHKNGKNIWKFLHFFRHCRVNLLRYVFFCNKVRVCANDFTWKTYICCDFCGDFFRSWKYSLYLCRKAFCNNWNASDKKESEKNENEVIFSGRIFFVWFVFVCLFAIRFECPINFGITRYGRLITIIIMWCHCGYASDSTAYVYAITFLTLYFTFLFCPVSAFFAITILCDASYYMFRN